MTRRFALSVFALAALACGGSADATARADTPAGPVTISLPTDGGFVARSITVGGVTYPYQVFVPKGFSRAHRWPVIVALAGSEERGSDNQKQIAVGLGPVVAAQHATFPAVVVFPQIPAGSGDVVADGFINASMPLLDQVMADFDGDPTRVYLTGLSAGGTFSYMIAYANPARFAAMVVAPGGVCTRCFTTTELATKLRALPIWIFQGANDPNLPPAGARALVQSFRSVSAPAVTYTEYPNLAHDVWDTAYASSDLYAWLFAQHR